MRRAAESPFFTSTTPRATWPLTAQILPVGKVPQLRSFSFEVVDSKRGRDQPLWCTNVHYNLKPKANDTA